MKVVLVVLALVGIGVNLRGWMWLTRRQVAYEQSTSDAVRELLGKWLKGTNETVEGWVEGWHQQLQAELWTAERRRPGM